MAGHNWEQHAEQVAKGAYVKNQESSYGISLNGITVGLEEPPRKKRCYLKSLANTRGRPASVAIALPNGEQVDITIPPYHRFLITPPLPVADAGRCVTVACAAERSRGGDEG